MTKICLYGAPGAGKTTLSQELQRRLKIPLIEGDSLRPLAQEQVSQKADPFLYIGTSGSWRKFGDFTPENVVKGLVAVRKSLKPYIEKALDQNGPYIFEAAFIDPVSIKSPIKGVLVVTSDLASHRSNYFAHRKHSDDAETEFLATRIIQDYLITEAESYGTVILHNEGLVKDVVERLLRQL